MESKKILILSNHFITLYNFRRELIARLISHGHKVYISMPEDERNEYFAQLGCEIIVTPMSRRGMNPAQDIALLHRYKRIMREVQPDIIFSYTIKPNIYGTMASNALHYKQVCNVTGTGATFLHENLLAKLVRVLYRHSMKYAYKVFFQNSGDRDYFIRHHMVRDNWDMLPGSGVNLEQHAFSPMPEGGTVGFIYIGRVMAVKGVEQFMDCARAIRREHPETRFYMAGFIEEERYKAVIRIWEKTTDNVTAALDKGFSRFNPIKIMADSGARGSMTQMRQLAGMRGLMFSATGKTMELPIKSNFREGLNITEYFMGARSSRKSLSDTALRTADSGYLTRRLVDVSQEVIVREVNCDTNKGTTVSDVIDERDKNVLEPLADRIIGRFSLGDIVDPATGAVLVPNDTMISEEDATAITKAGITEVTIRTPIQCHARWGICSHCYGADMSTGSLGQGVSAAVGMAIANRLDGNDHRIYTLLGDGECQEGQVWEAAMAAAHFHLDNLCIIVDHNGLQIDGEVAKVMNVDSLEEKFRAFNLHVISIDGHDFEAIRSAFAQARATKGRPTAIIAHTVKGKGISFMENVAGWHGVAPNDEDYERAISELGGK